MKLHLYVVVLAALLITAPMASAQSGANVTQADMDRALATTRVYLAESSRWVAAHNQVMVERNRHISELQEGAQTLEQRAASDPAGAQTAATQWVSRQTEIFATDRAALAALPNPPRLNIAPAVMALPGMREELAGPVAHIESLQPRYADFLDMTDRIFATYTSAIVAAISAPDQEQAFRLADIDFAVASLESETALLETSLPPEGVQRFGTMANIHSNKALAQWLQHMADLWRGTLPSRSARAATIRGLTADIRIDADRLVEAATAQHQANLSNPALNRAFLDPYQASFVESAGIEREMATVLDQLAEALAASDDDAGAALADRIGGLNQRRVSAQFERQRLMQELSRPAA